MSGKFKYLKIRDPRKKTASLELCIRFFSRENALSKTLDNVIYYQKSSRYEVSLIHACFPCFFFESEMRKKSKSFCRYRQHKEPQARSFSLKKKKKRYWDMYQFLFMDYFRSREHSNILTIRDIDKKKKRANLQPFILFFVTPLRNGKKREKVQVKDSSFSSWDQLVNHFWGQIFDR